MQRRSELPEETALIKHDKLVRQRRRNEVMYKYNKAWNRQFWPIIVASVHPHRPKSVYMSLVYVLQPEYTEIFLQRWMDDGGSDETFERMHREVEWLRDNYDILPPVVKRRMRKYLDNTLQSNLPRRANE